MISVANDDVCYQHGGDSYVRGYSDGAQKIWLERALADARNDRTIDWVVICMHQVAISTVDKFNGADLGIREEWVPLFDKYGVDLVVCGHEHHYERSHPIRGSEANETLTPRTVGTETDVIDTTQGTVHMVLGGGGTSVPSNELFFSPRNAASLRPSGRRTRRPVNGRRFTSRSLPHGRPYATRRTPMDSRASPSTRNRRGGVTEIKVTYYDVVGAEGQIAPFESFTLRRPRRD